MLWRPCYRLRQRRQVYEQGRRRQDQTLVLGNHAVSMETLSSSLWLRRPLQRALRSRPSIRCRLRDSYFTSPSNRLSSLEFCLSRDGSKSQNADRPPGNVEPRTEDRFDRLDLLGHSAGDGSAKPLLLRERLLHGLGKQQGRKRYSE